MGEKNNPSLHRFALLTAGATFLLIIAGALVTSKEAGLAVPDWPLSYGTWMPPMVGNIVYEHGHRMLAAGVGLLSTILTVWLWKKEPRSWVRWLGLVALGAIVAQGLLGGITVLYFLPQPVSIAHASLAQIFFSLTVSLALFTSPSWRKKEPKALDADNPPLPRLCEATTLALFAQLVLGAAFRHSALGIVPHLVGAAVVTLGAVWTTKRVWQRYSQQPELLRPALALAGLLGAQLLLGTGAYLARIATADGVQPPGFLVVLTVAHVTVGALALAASVILTLQAHRSLARPGHTVPLASATQKAAI